MLTLKACSSGWTPAHDAYNGLANSPVSQPGVRQHFCNYCPTRILTADYGLLDGALSSVVTYAGVSGMRRAWTPVASKKAAATAGGPSALAASEPPPKPLSSREIWTTLISGVSSIVRILWRVQLVLVTLLLSKVTSSLSASLRPMTTPLFMQRSSCRGLMILPQSTPMANLVTCTAPVDGVTAISAMPTQYASLRTTMHRPRPVTEALPVLRAPGCGEGRGSHPAALAVALRISIRRWSAMWLMRNWMGSAPADAAASFIKPSSAKFCWRCPGVRMMLPRSPPDADYAARFGMT